VADVIEAEGFRAEIACNGREARIAYGEDQLSI
jgi:hypothetical protein